MTLEDILEDIHSLEDELRSYERKYGVLSETFYDAYSQGEEPASPAWVRDWTAWASAYTLWLRRREQYRSAIQALRMGTDTVTQVIEKTARHDPIPVAA
ncbi:MAG: hypothetical protein HY321_03270 [Armatimonadetes bacterium]|nr:hypothetical protein [Armatimonadota bacterium]